jgi:hypothetical protein
VHRAVRIQLLGRPWDVPALRDARDQDASVDVCMAPSSLASPQVAAEAEDSKAAGGFVGIYERNCGCKPECCSHLLTLLSVVWLQSSNNGGLQYVKGFN